MGSSASALSETVPQEQAAFSWRFATGGQIRSRPAVAADGTVYAIAEDSYLYALSSDGQLNWKCDLGWLPGDCLAVGEDGTIYAGLTNRDLVAVNPRGAAVWRVHLDGLAVGDPLVGADGTLYIGVAPGTLLAMSHLGRELWTVTLPGSLVAAPVMDGTGTIYLAASDRRLYALTPWGEFKWSLPLPAQPTPPAIAADGTVVVGTAAGDVFAVSSKGDIAWHRAIGAPAAGVSVGPDQIVAATSTGLLVGLSVKGREIWRADTRSRLDSAPLLSGAGVVAFSRDGNLIELQPPRGAPRRFTVGASGGAGMARDGSLYLGGRDWVLYAFPGDSGGSVAVGPVPAAPWPQPGHDARHSGRTSAAPRGGIDALLNANPDYLYLYALEGSGSRDLVEMFLSEARSRIARGSLGKSTWYVVKLLEKVVGTGVITPAYENLRVVNDFPDLRAEAASMLAQVGSEGSRWSLLRVARAEPDAYALSEEVRALGALASDPDGASARTIAAGFSRVQTDVSDNRLAAAVVEAVGNIAAYNGTLEPSAAKALFSIAHGRYLEEIRKAAADGLKKE